MKRSVDWVTFALLFASAIAAYAQEVIVTGPRYFGADLAMIPLITWVCVIAYALAGTLARLHVDIKSGETEKKLLPIIAVLVIGQIVGHLVFLACEGVTWGDGINKHMPYWLEGLLIFAGAFNRKRVLDFLSKMFAKVLERLAAFITKFTG